MPAEHTLEARTRALLVNRPRTLEYETISNDTQLTVWWLCTFAKDGASLDYGIRRVQRLHDYLVNHKAVA